MKYKKALFWFFPILLTAGLALGEGLGDGGLYGIVEGGGGAAFDGDLAGSNLIDSTGDVAVVDSVTVAGSITGTGFVATTPSTVVVAGAATEIPITSSVHKIDCDAGGNTIATITGAWGGTYLYLEWIDADCTITDSGGAGAADTVDLTNGAFTSADDAVLLLVHDATRWHEVARTPLPAAGFDGDLATDTALVDSSDGVIDVADSFNFNTSGTTMDCDTTDGVCRISNAANTSGTLHLGPDAASGMKFVSTNTIMALEQGSGSFPVMTAQQFRSGQGVTVFNLKHSSSNGTITLDNEGRYGWDDSSTAATATMGLCADGTNDVVWVNDNTNCVAAFAGDSDGSFAIGRSFGGNKPTCAATKRGLMHYDPDGATGAQPAQICVSEYDGSSVTYRWQALGTPGHAGVYVSTPGTITVSGSATWYDVFGGTIAYTVTKNAGWSWTEPELTVILEGEGWYKVSYSISYSLAAGTDVIQTGIGIDDEEGAPTITEQAQCRTERTISSTGVADVAATCLIEILDADGTNNDSITLRVNNTTGTQDIIIQQANMVVEQI